MDSASFQTFGKSSAITTLSVTKPSGQLDSQATALVSFGKDPVATTEVAKGVGIYSTPFCLAGSGSGNAYTTDYISNCGLTATIAKTTTGVDDPVTPGHGIELVNAIEINWALPYAIPNDRTVADIVCDTQQKARASGSDDNTRLADDPLRIHQASMMA